MDLTPIAVPVITSILSIGAVSAFLAKYVSKVVKYVRLAADAVNALDHLAEDLKDGMITAEELNALVKDVEKFKADLKA